MCHPDRNISLFSDLALGIASSPELLPEYASRSGLDSIKTSRQPITNLQDSGYVRIEKGAIVGFLDDGEIGPRYKSGHAHADTLSL